MATRWADDYDAIRRRRAEIAEEEVPHCPRNPNMKLFNCLRSSAQCQPECPLKADWIGPQKES